MYSTIVIIDMESMTIIYRDNSNYHGYPYYMKPSRSPLEGAAQGVQQQDQATQQADYGTAQGTNAQFEGPVQDSPYYKSMVASTADSTSDAYQNAEAASRAKANQSGFGEASPIGQAADREVVNAEAGAQAKIPAEAMQATAPLALQASGQTAQMGTAAGGQGAQYFGDATDLEKQYQQQKQAFQNKLWDTGSSIFNENPYGVFGQQ